MTTVMTIIRKTMLNAAIMTNNMFMPIPPSILPRPPTGQT